jgi:hypothetical protein
MSRTLKKTGLVAGLGMILVSTACGDVVTQGRGASQASVTLLEGAAGVKPQEFGGTLSSDVLTLVKKTAPGGGGQILVPTIFSDPGRVTVTVTMKNTTAPAAPSPGPNDVTFNRYRVVYLRADGRNTPGVDVPYPFDSAATFTATPGGSVQAGFELVRITAKQEAPLKALETNSTFISTIAQVTFYGRDASGNDVTVSGNIGVTFGNFGDPD